MLEPSLDLYGQTFDQVDSLLKELISRSHARYAMIVDDGVVSWLAVEDAPGKADQTGADAVLAAL